MGSLEQALHGAEYRQFLPDLSSPRFTTMAKQDAHAYAEEFKTGGKPPWLHALYMHWLDLLKEPYKGITNDGKLRPDVFTVQDEGVPIDDIVSAANVVLDSLTPEQAKLVKHHVDAPEWRTWSNPEFLLSDKGIRMDEVAPALRAAVFRVLEATLSPEGYQKALGATRVNGFLGELVRAPAVLNEFSYNFVLFGEPSPTRPWGFAFYGHHLCLNVFLYRTQIVVSPCFTGAEPNLVDAGPHAGTRILEAEERLGLRLMQSLPPAVQAAAQTYALLRDPAMPPGRWNHDDQRHLCGAYRDNRTVPYEGVLVADMGAAQQALVLAIANEYLLYLPRAARQVRLDGVRAWFRETYFSWIGGYGDADPFYYRIQSPVIILEFDHHAGVFLANKEPAKFHIHTILRTPNAGDYGMALRPQIAPIEQDWCWPGERDEDGQE